MGDNERIEIFADSASLAVGAADRIAELLRSAISTKGVATLVLSGGNTPRAIYEAMLMRSGSAIEWSHVHLFFGDERFVPESDARSNLRMAKESFIDRISIPTENVHPIRTEFATSQLAATHYDEELHSFFGTARPRFDIVLLGLGPDGHTASIFPSTTATSDASRYVIATASPLPPTDRISMTIEVIDQARAVIFLVSGSEKAEIFAKVIASRSEGRSKAYPAARIHPEGELFFLIDRAAASLLR